MYKQNLVAMMLTFGTIKNIQHNLRPTFIYIFYLQDSVLYK